MAHLNNLTDFPYLISQSFLVAHDCSCMMGVLLLEMFQESFSLFVHIGGLHAQDFFGTPRAAYSVSPRNIAARLRSLAVPSRSEFLRPETLCII